MYWVEMSPSGVAGDITHLFVCCVDLVLMCILYPGTFGGLILIISAEGCRTSRSVAWESLLIGGFRVLWQCWYFVVSTHVAQFMIPASNPRGNVFDQQPRISHLLVTPCPLSPHLEVNSLQMPLLGKSVLRILFWRIEVETRPLPCH